MTYFFPRDLTSHRSSVYFPGHLPPGAPWPLSALEWRSFGLECCSLYIFSWPVSDLPSSSRLTWFPSSSWLTFMNRWSTTSSNLPRRDTEKIIFDSATICKRLYLAYSVGNGLMVFWFQFPCIGPLFFFCWNSRYKCIRQLITEVLFLTFPLLHAELLFLL